MTAVIQALRDIVPVPVSVALGVVLAIVVADLLQRLVERPMTRVGREMAKAFNRRWPSARVTQPVQTVA